MSKTDDKTIKTNKALVEKYPWLLPRNRWTGEVVEDYNYEYTELDALPTTWREVFGEDLVRDLDEAFKKLPPKTYNNIRVLQIKEKWGGLRVYLSGYNDDISKVINHYAAISERTCFFTGQPTMYRTTGYILPISAEAAIDKYGQGQYNDEPIYDPTKQTVEEYLNELVEKGFITKINNTEEDEE